MSAYVVGKRQIDYLVLGGLELPPRIYRPMRWFWPAITEQDAAQAGVPGVAITHGDVKLAEQRSWVLTRETADRVGAMLWSENVRSVSYRYDEPEDAEGLPGPIGFSILDAAAYHWQRPVSIHEPPKPLAVLQAISCFEYQSCEHPGWRSSEAREFIEALTWQAIRAIPGYDHAEFPR